MTIEDKEFLESFNQQLNAANEGTDPTEPVDNSPGSDEELEPQEPENIDDNPDPTEVENTDEDEISEENIEDGGGSEEVEEIDYKEMYEKITSPFKANGKQIEIKNPQEAIQLMQMGANYTRKMQEISQHKKVIATLHEHGISSDSDIAFLIDLKNKNPEAIKKYFKDNGIDPFDIDTSDEVNYKPNAQMLSESDVEAKEVLRELNSTPEGAKTLNMIADTWDDDSTAYMWKNPQAFKLIHEQRESGVFDQIMSEVDRQTALGILTPGGSILEKYNTVGNQLFGVGQPQNSNTAQPIDTRVATRSSAQRSNRAKAAGSPRASKRTSMVLEDLLGLDDDKFLEAMKQKL